MSINEGVALDEMIGRTAHSGSFRHQNKLSIEAHPIPRRKLLKLAVNREKDSRRIHPPSVVDALREIVSTCWESLDGVDDRSGRDEEIGESGVF